MEKAKREKAQAIRVIIKLIGKVSLPPFSPSFPLFLTPHPHYDVIHPLADPLQ